MKKTNKISFKQFSEKFFVLSSFLSIAFILWGISPAINTAILWEFSWLILLIFNRKILNFNVEYFSLKILLLLTTIYFLLHIIGLSYTKNINEGLQNILIKMHLVIIPIIILSTSHILKKHIYSLLNIYIFSAFVATFALIITAFVKSLYIVDGHLVFQASIRPGFSFFQSVVWPGNNFFYFRFSIFHHPSYMATLILMAIPILLFIKPLQTKNKNFIDKILYKKWLKIILVIYFSIIVMMLMSKANYLVLIAVFLVYFLTLKIKTKYKSGIILLWTIFSVAMIYYNPRYQIFLKNFYNDLTNKNTVKVPSGTDRLFYWKRSIKLIKENFWTGVGTGDVNDMMVDKTDKILDKPHNNHNEYLETFVRLGVFGEIIFLLIFILLIRNAIKNKNYFLISILLIIFINYFFESMLDRITGVLLTAIFLSYGTIAGLNKNYDNQASELEKYA